MDVLEIELTTLQDKCMYGKYPGLYVEKKHQKTNGHEQIGQTKTATLVNNDRICNLWRQTYTHEEEHNKEAS